MNSKQTLAIWNKLSKCIAEEITSNEAFAKKISDIIEDATPKSSASAQAPKKSNRRAKAKVNPFLEYDAGEAALLAALEPLNIEELKDVVAENGMDSARLAMKWKNREKLVALIVDMTKRRSSRGDAFWNTSTIAKPSDVDSPSGAISSGNDKNPEESAVPDDIKQT